MSAAERLQNMLLVDARAMIIMSLGEKRTIVVAARPLLNDKVNHSEEAIVRRADERTVAIGLGFSQASALERHGECR
jgi:hypothetical protein